MHTALFLTSDTPLSLFVDILPGLYIQHYFLIQIDILPIDTYSIIFDFRHTTFIVHGHIACWYIQHYFWLQTYHFHCPWTDCLDCTYSTIFDFRYTTFIVRGHIAWTIHTALFLTSDIPPWLSMDTLPGLYIQHYFWRQIYHLACPWTHCPDYTFSTIFDFRYTSFIVHGHIPWTLYTALFLTSDIQLWMSMDILPGLYTQHSFWLQP